MDVILNMTRLHNKESAGKSLLMTMLVPSAKESKVIANTMVDLLRTNIAKKKYLNIGIGLTFTSESKVKTQCNY